MKSVLKVIGLAVVLLLSACVNFGPDNSLIGQDRAAVITKMGPPSRERPLATGSRLEYPRGPFGKSTFFVLMNREGKVTGWHDVLTPENFNKITPNMRSDEVELLIGQSQSIVGLAMGDRRVWNYPFHNSICQVFQVIMTPEGKVDSKGYGYAPECGSSW